MTVLLPRTQRARTDLGRYPSDDENRLTEAATRKQKVRYKYDALGRRVRRYTPGVREDTKFTNDGQDVLVDDAAGTQTKYLNGPGIDNKLRVQTGSSVNYFLTDQLGSTNGLADSTGALVSSTTYDSFGNSTINNFPSRYRFTGREVDSFSGLQFSRARFYDPTLGRFISEDPIGLVAGTNLFAYVGNNPTQFTDPFGLFPSIWPWDRHQDIGSNALAGLAPPAQINAFNNANGTFDMRTQDPIYAPYHSMSRPGQNPSEARDEANEFMRRKICMAKNYADRGLPFSAMEALGQAAHTMHDNNSPAHANFQEAWPNTRFFTIINGWHYIKETFFPGEENVRRAENDTRRVWDYFKGDPMPRDLLANSGPVQMCECPK